MLGHVSIRLTLPTLNQRGIRPLNRLCTSLYVKSASNTYCSYFSSLSGSTKTNFSCLYLGMTIRSGGLLQTKQLPRIVFTNRGMSQNLSPKQKSVVIYLGAFMVFMLGATYAAVPLYRIFCQATGRGGQAIKTGKSIEDMKTVDRYIDIQFSAETVSSMQWKFKPQQEKIRVKVGETALAFYSATNPTDKPIIGVSTYNILPFEAGQYFNKIQCFCFEDQLLNPHEEVDLPVFFYIDPAYAEDPRMDKEDSIVLSYTFFQAKDGFKVPVPGFMQEK